MLGGFRQFFCIKKYFLEQSILHIISSLRWASGLWYPLPPSLFFSSSWPQRKYARWHPNATLTSPTMWMERKYIDKKCKIYGSRPDKTNSKQMQKKARQFMDDPERIASLHSVMFWYYSSNLKLLVCVIRKGTGQDKDENHEKFTTSRPLWLHCCHSQPKSHPVQWGQHWPIHWLLFQGYWGILSFIDTAQVKLHCC